MNFPSWPARGAVIYHEVHGNGRLGNLLERNRLWMHPGEQSVSPMCRSAIPEIATMEPIPASAYFYFIQTVKLVQLADLYAFRFSRDRDG